MTAIAACRTCGTEPRLNARFCHVCGSPIQQGTSRAEYKQVTVVFADVVHSMDIAAAVGAERFHEIMADLADRSTAVVKRYGGTVDKFTGDGIMAIFGAPMALEDHAIRACRAALGIQETMKQLAADVRARDGLDLRLRIGLNSGQVIAGGIGTGPFGYTAIGVQVGLAQRMESAAPPGGVMLSMSTARLIEGAANLAGAELVHVKGSDAPVLAHLLLGVSERERRAHAVEAALVGRQTEMAHVNNLLHRAIGGHGSVVSVMGPPGIGKSRLTREAAQIAAADGFEVFTTYCESHTSEIPFRVVAGLLRAATGVNGLDSSLARERVRGQVPDGDPEDVLLFEDFLGIADPKAILANIDPDARRRRLTVFVNTALLARARPALFVIEDVHWIDEVSESMLADFLTVIPQTASLVLITYRPEYRGRLRSIPESTLIALAPLSDPETAALVSQLLGPDSSVVTLASAIVERAAGNPFFAEEMVRDLAERAVLHGGRGAYVCAVDAAEVTVPASVQATLAARVDRLNPGAKRTLNAAAVIGAKFTRDLLETLGIDPVLEDLVRGEMIDQTSFTHHPEYVFHHPLIRTVAYESQLKSDRAELHRRLAAAIEVRSGVAVDENASLIAEHLAAAGDLPAAYDWHMRAATWTTNRDIVAARVSWERARIIADALPADTPKRAVMGIAARTMLCGTGWRVHADATGERVDELRDLCSAVGDKASLGIATAGLVVGYAHQDRVREASHLASEAWAVAESVGDADLMVGLSFPVIYGKIESGEWGDVMRWSQAVADLADGDVSVGNFLVGSPLALAYTTRGMARYFFGSAKWRDDLSRGLVMARDADPASGAGVVSYVYLLGVPFGALLPHDHALHEIENALRIAERSSDDVVVGFTQATLGVALLHRNAIDERIRGQRILEQVSELFRSRRHNLCDLPLAEVYVARETARRGDRAAALAVMRAAADHLFRQGYLLLWGIVATAVLVETLLESGTNEDMGEAEAAIDRLAAARTDEGLMMRDIWVVRLRALLARARGDTDAYDNLSNEYRSLAKDVGYEGHLAWAETMR